jgi:hypothetical protein
MFRAGLILGLFFSFVGVSTAAAPTPPPRPKSPIALSVAFDRPAYYRFEPIWVDWALTNVSLDPLAVAPCPVSRSLGFRCIDVDGKESRLRHLSSVDAQKPPPFVLLRPGEGVRGWFNLREDHDAVPPRGRFSLSPFCYAVYAPGPDAAPPLEKVVGEPLDGVPTRLEILPPQGHEREAIRFLLGDFGRDPKNLDDPRLLPGDSEYRCGTWASQHEVRNAVLKQVKSERFLAPAYFHQAIWDLPWDWAPPRGYNFRQTVELLRCCRDSPGSSRYLKGLATLHIALCRLHEGTPESGREARRLAEGLIADFPNTAIAQDAKKLLARLKPE